ncbi:MAG: heme-copper oxidase subunit III [Halodesulfurarchaeum sp.]|nr:heme-copper oxidase subunit III [Halodesulfurarchaeum sp.]
MATKDGEQGQHHLPAPNDWPKGFGEASLWPVVAALGVTGIYLGFGLWLLARAESAFGPAVLGPVFVILGVLAFLGGLYGWLYQGFIAHFWEREGSAGKFRWAMILFLGTEIFTFGAGFVYYFFIRAGPWPPGELPTLVSSLVLVNTAILVASSVTLHYGHLALRNGDRKRYKRLLGATLGLGIVFLAGQGYEYYEFVIGEGLSFASGPYYSAFFGLTGLHGLHVGLGVVLLAILAVRTLAGQYSKTRHTSVSTVTMYWHFVDAVWIFLVATLYVGAVV